MQPRDRDHQDPGRRLAGIMSDSTTAGASRDRPDAYIPRDRRWALHHGHALPDRVRGSALFADISGFTPLTEALVKELGPQRGAEELTANIGRVFHAVIGELDAYDGNVIYFAGDAITCWIDGDDGTRGLRRRDGHAGGDRTDGPDRHAGRGRGPAGDEGRDRGGRRPPVRGR